MGKIAVLKAVAVGNQYSGKTLLCTRLSDREPDMEYVSTIGVDYMVKFMLEDDIKIQFWDLAGDPCFENIILSYIKSSYYILLVYDTTEPSSLTEIISFYNRYIDTIFVGCKFYIVVGTKIDKKFSHYDIHKGKEFANSINAPHVLTSSKTKEGIQDIVDIIVTDYKGETQNIKNKNINWYISVKNRFTKPYCTIL